MQRLAAEQRRVLGRRAPWHVGDIAWGLKEHEGREHEWRVPDLGGARRARRVDVAQGASGTLEHDVRAGRHDLLDEMLDEPDARVASAFEDDAETRAVLARHGFERPRRAACTSSPATSPSRRSCLPLPDGFRYRTVEPRDLRERVSIHRAVWAPSRVTQSSFTKVQAAWPYRASLDCVVEAPDGRFAAYCHVWPDDENARRRARAGRRPLRLPPARPRRRGLHVRAAAAVRGGRARGDRLLRVGARVRALPVDRLRPARHARRLRARMNRLAHETSPYLLQHADNPGRLVPVGRGGVRARPRGGQADPALDRLRRLPLVPRHGARVVRGRDDGGADERALRQRQGRSRGAARRRRALHGRGRRRSPARAAGR